MEGHVLKMSFSEAVETAHIPIPHVCIQCVLPTEVQCTSGFAFHVAVLWGLTKAHNCHVPYDTNFSVQNVFYAQTYHFTPPGHILYVSRVLPSPDSHS